MTEGKENNTTGGENKVWTTSLSIDHLLSDEIDLLEPLWLALLDHVRKTGSMVPIRDPSESWAMRRALYEDWLADGESFALGAWRDGRLAGYAMVRVAPPDPVWATGSRFAELMSLSVDPPERGRGVGSSLFAAVERELLSRGIDELIIGVDAPNEPARRFYEQRGFKVGYHLMHGRLRPEGKKAVRPENAGTADEADPLTAGHGEQ